MDISFRSVLTAGISAVTATAIVASPVTTPPPAAVAAPSPTAMAMPVQNTASVSSLAQPTEPDVLAPMNTASNVIDDVYAFAKYWADYLVEGLAPWALGWIPLGYLVADQIFIWYPEVLRVTDAFVYNLIDPVVNDPLNLSAWVDGIGAVLNAVATGIADGIRREIEYVVTLGWLPFPLPPLPGLVTTAISPESLELDPAAVDTLTPDVPDPDAVVEDARVDEKTAVVDETVGAETPLVEAEAQTAVEVALAQRAEEFPVTEPEQTETTEPGAETDPKSAAAELEANVAAEETPAESGATPARKRTRAGGFGTGLNRALERVTTDRAERAAERAERVAKRTAARAASAPTADAD